MNRTLPAMAAMTLAISMSCAGLAQAAVPSKLQNLEVDGKEMPVEEVLESPMEGLYEVHLTSGESFYTDSEGSYFLLGDLYENGPEGLVNLSEKKRNERRADRLTAIADDDQVIYRGADEPKAVIHVFTDTTCPYCRKFHEEVPKLNEMGIQVNYLAFPRGGMLSEGARELTRVWCSDNRTEALTAAKQGEVPEEAASCDNPVEQQYRLGLEMGVQGTPAIVLPDGRLVPGYVPADRLAGMLGVKS
uniref:DsbC family protein n=1 Tax=Halomonas sp. TaxID=1486246 RepID=UPI002621E279|nr:DsbC family protein [Halomonas sp.]